MLKVILWDLDGTILDFHAAEAAAIRKCFEIFNLGPCTDEMLQEYSQINDKYWKMLERGEMTKPRILVERYREFFGNHGIDTSCVDAFNSEYQLRLGDFIIYMPGALELLKEFKGKYLQCAITNGTKRAQDNKMERSGLNKVFDKIFISEVVGYEKPRKEFFDEVFREIGEFKPGEVIVIGDSPTSDILGANNAGLPAIWFNPKHAENKVGAKFDYEIDDLGELLNIVNKL